MLRSDSGLRGVGKAVLISVPALALLGLAPSVASATTVAAAPTTSVVAPSADPFYSAPATLKNFAPGAVIRSRQITINAAGAIPSVSASQVLYRTQNQLGQASATVATIIKPLVQVGSPKLLSYQTFYDGVADTCRPSYTLQGGDSSNTQNDIDSTLALGYVAQGYTVVTSDYEGPTDDYGAGRESGYGTLDAIRAAEYELGVSQVTTPVGLVGYSGGSIASEWASELQPTYAPKLHLIGIAEGGIPVDYTHNLNYINGSSDWAGAIPAIVIGLARAYHVTLSTYLSAYGQQVVAQVEQGCLNPTAFPGLTFQQMLKPQYQNWQTVPIFKRMFNDSIMGRTSVPAEPLLMGVGNADGTGDGVMIASDVQQLAYQYCHKGDNVQFNVYTGANHDEAALVFEPQALAFLNTLYSGLGAANGCGSITPGNALTPLP